MSAIDATLAHGDREFQKGSYELAETYFEEAHAHEPSSSLILIRLGLTKIKQGKIGEGIQLLRIALEHDPSDMRCLYELAAAYMEAGDLKTSEQYFMQIISAGTECVKESHLALGHMYFEGDHFGLAQDHFEKAHEIDRNDLDARIHIIWIYAYGTQYQLALAVIEETLEIFPGDTTLLELQDKCLGALHWGFFLPQSDTSYCNSDRPPINRFPGVNVGAKPHQLRTSPSRRRP